MPDPTKSTETIDKEKIKKFFGDIPVIDYTKIPVRRPPMLYGVKVVSSKLDMDSGDTNTLYINGEKYTLEKKRCLEQ